MSRIGKAPVAIPSGVTVTVNAENVVTVKGPKGELKETVDRDVTVTVKDGEVCINGAKILSKDRQGTNGVIHSVDTVNIPGE